MFLCRLRLVVFLRRLLAGIRVSALGEALSSASWAAATDKASVVELTREESNSSRILDVQPNLQTVSILPFLCLQHITTLCGLSRMNLLVISN